MPQTAFRPNHMHIAWHDYTSHDTTLPISAAPLREKASVIGRTGLMLLSCGTGAWRVRSSMNTLAEELGLVCAADIGLTSIEYTCFDGEQAFSQTLTLTSTGVNTSKLNRLEQFVAEFTDICSRMTGEQLHTHLDEIEQVHGLYSPLMLGLAAALACGAFTFLLGGGWVEMILAFFGAGIGNAVRCKLSKHHLTLVLCTTVSVAAACLVYAGCLKIAEMTCGINVQHEAGYICSMLFIIPGFPFITSGIDMAKLDMRSGLERLSYAVDFLPLNLSMLQYIVFRLLTSFCGVFGFSIMFNSPVPLAMSAAVIGAISNTLRLELVDLASLPPAAAAFFAAMIAGLLASAYKKHSGFPRIAITVPSIVIMVPGLYLYRAIYNLGMMNLSISASWFASATLIIFALPLGLIFARIMTDKMFRYCT